MKGHSHSWSPARDRRCHPASHGSRRLVRDDCREQRCLYGVQAERDRDDKADQPVTGQFVAARALHLARDSDQLESTGTTRVDGAHRPAGAEGRRGAGGASRAEGRCGLGRTAGGEGDPGAAGPSGPAGPQGPQCPKGDTGLVGSQGPKGDPGSAGAGGPRASGEIYGGDAQAPPQLYGSKNIVSVSRVGTGQYRVSLEPSIDFSTTVVLATSVDGALTVAAHGGINSGRHILPQFRLPRASPSNDV